MYYRIKELLEQPIEGQEIEVRGWVRTFRGNQFVSLNDGSTIVNLQCVIDFENQKEEILKKINCGTSLSLKGKYVESEGKNQTSEVKVSEIYIYGESNPEKYPIQPKKHSLEFLRSKAHLRIRTTTFASIMRVRSALSFAVHQYFHQRNFQHVHTPIITGSDAEGAGELFRVTTLPEKGNKEGLSKEEYFADDFFGKETNLTVSGQLEAETYALGLGNVYTFGPTFRAENSNTTRHLAEFWMIEPEMAFYELKDNMDLVEDFIKHVILYVLDNCSNEIEFLNDRFAKEEQGKPKLERSELGLIEKLTFVTQNAYKRVSYTEAIDILKNSKPNKKKKFKYPVDHWGIDLQSEHERYLVEKHFKCPVILYDYPANIKAFYMKLNDDGNTVRAMDVLFPGIGEMVGGSQREERLDVLEKRIEALGIDTKELEWYLDLRRFGTVPHSGFGLGFERLVLFVTGMGNVRDVIPYPRTPQNASF